MLVVGWSVLDMTAQLTRNPTAMDRGVLLTAYDAAQQLVNGGLGGGDVAVAADFTVGAGIGDGDGSLFFMDVKSDVEFRGRV